MANLCGPDFEDHKRFVVNYLSSLGKFSPVIFNKICHGGIIWSSNEKLLENFYAGEKPDTFEVEKLLRVQYCGSSKILPCFVIVVYRYVIQLSTRQPVILFLIVCTYGGVFCFKYKSLDKCQMLKQITKNMYIDIHINLSTSKTSTIATTSCKNTSLCLDR